jgi:hypothetical protein
MSIFKSEKLIPISVADLEPVAREVQVHFQQRHYQVTSMQTAAGTWEVDITSGGMFKAAVGLKSALKIQIEAMPRGTMVRAGAGIFGKQAVATVITMFVAWPVILTQAWGIIRQAGLDDEAIRIVEVSLSRHDRAARGTNGQDPKPEEAYHSPGAANGVSGTHCAGCGNQLAQSSRFCPHCGKVQVG